MVHANAPRAVGACRVTVKCSDKKTILNVVPVHRKSNGTETALTQLCLAGMITCETEFTSALCEGDRSHALT